MANKNMGSKIHYRIPGFDYTACGVSWMTQECSSIIGSVTCKKCIDWYHKDMARDECPNL